LIKKNPTLYPEDERGENITLDDFGGAKAEI
jgi:hypothetical protein